MTDIEFLEQRIAKRRAYVQAYYQEHKQRILKDRKIHYEKNKEKLRAKNRRDYKALKKDPVCYAVHLAYQRERMRRHYAETSKQEAVS